MNERYIKQAQKLFEIIQQKDLGKELEEQILVYMHILEGNYSDDKKHQASIMAEYYLSIVRDFPNRVEKVGHRPL